MRIYLLAIAFFLTQASQAIGSGRMFVCHARDGFDQRSTFEIDIDSGAIRMKEWGSSDWTQLYDNNLNCGRKTPKSVTCSRHLVHNFADPQRPSEAATDTIRCVDSSGRELIDYNGKLEINLNGDGSGVFACGLLMSRHVALKRCRAKNE